MKPLSTLNFALVSRCFTFIGTLILFFSTLPAQNLVLNPSFESFSSCPIGPSEFSNATNWDDPLINVVTDTCSTSDLFNTCSPLGSFGVGVPGNILGNEAARTGNGYAGIIMNERVALFGCTSFFGSNWREYVHGQLSAPLTAGQTYCVTFYASLADNVKYATDDFGVFFSNGPIAISCAVNGNGPLPFSPQLTWTGGDITNTSGWTELQWSYTATGGEQFITIGNFLDDAAASFSCANGSAFNPYAYYYIDDVSVEPGSCGVLPVQLALFEGEAEVEGNRLEWETDAEVNSAFFELERSGDGEGWEMLERIESYAGEKGNFYEAWDHAPETTTFYRLIQQDVNGDRRILKQIVVQREEQMAFHVGLLAPNPARDRVSVQCTAHDTPVRVLIIDFQGRQVYEQLVPPSELSRELVLDLEGIGSGLYKVEFRSGNYQTAQSLQIQ